MSESLSIVWEQVSALLDIGISVIPVRDQEVQGKPAKTPYGNWKQYQQRIITPQELWALMERYNTTAIAMICGPISGNLEVIDIDVKNWAGIDARYFEAIRELYPDLWQNLRIHSTPSGGYHILYRIDRPGTGNQKLATASTSTQAGIETRGVGGYIVAPPSLGYQVYRDNPIPLVTWEQRESLINLAKSFDEKVKVVAAPTLPKNKSDYYDENPFEHFNGSSAAESILVDQGWTRERSGNSHYQYFTRPGKSTGISASFIHRTRLYYIFTSSTVLEPSRAYDPAAILCRLRFNGDAKATYEWLVANGYGKIAPRHEQRLIRARVLDGDALPGNASEEAKVTYQTVRLQLQERYPHGTYWVQEDDENVVKINRERLYHVANRLGFRYYQTGLVQIEGYLIRHVTDRYFYDTLKAYCTEPEADFLEAIRNAFEAFIQRAGTFTITRVQLLDENALLNSDKRTCYKFYRNGYVRITATERSFQLYADLPPGRLIWEEQLIPRDHILSDASATAHQSLYYQFLEKAIGITPYLWQLIGYLAHDYKDETMGYFVVLVESCANPREGGGTGKNLFCNLLSHITTVKNLSGSQVQLNEKLLQAWQYERVLVISDVPKHFNFTFFKELSTGSATKKNLYRDEIILAPHLLPKLVFSTNYSFENVDGGILRRIRPLEFSSFFTKIGGVDQYFGKLFPQDWTAEDWQAYDWLLHQAIQSYLANPKIPAQDLSTSGWNKQFDQTYHFSTRGFILEHWELWQRTKFVSNDDFKQAYDLYCNANGVQTRYRLTAFRLNEALEDYCRRQGVFYDRNAVQRFNNIAIRGRSFQSLVPAPF